VTKASDPEGNAISVCGVYTIAGNTYGYSSTAVPLSLQNTNIGAIKVSTAGVLDFSPAASFHGAFDMSFFVCDSFGAQQLVPSIATIIIAQAGKDTALPRTDPYQSNTIL
jgi:hypothetical protein